MTREIGPSLDAAGILSLRIFVTVAEAQSFSAAARQMRLSPSAVTNHVLSLERMLGVALFHRTTRKVAITAVGGRFYKQSVAILGQVEEALENVVPSQEPLGHLRVTAPPSFAVRVIGPHLGGFLTSHPKVSVDMIVSSAVPNMVADRIDVAILLREEPQGKLSHVPLGSNPRAFCASHEYVARAGTPRTPRDLAKHRCLANMVAGGAEPWSFRMGQEVRQIQVDGPLLSDNGEILRRACLSGTGIGNFYRFHVREDLEHGDLIEVLANYQPDTNRIYAMVPHREMVRPLAQLFIDFVRGVVGSLVPKVSAGNAVRDVR
jgi:DNA-binding transcriptional LysR family regulator